ncbi:MAG: hypothetical protein LBL07_03760 [Tannerella sp.]|jgi:hypothetical protein|nr:hypothetical protein [Tannerella sp.]
MNEKESKVCDIIRALIRKTELDGTEWMKIGRKARCISSPKVHIEIEKRDSMYYFEIVRRGVAEDIYEYSGRAGCQETDLDCLIVQLHACVSSWLDRENDSLLDSTFKELTDDEI